MRARKPSHLRSFDYTGFYRYSLTFCTHERRPLFQNATTVALVFSQISRASAEREFAVIAYCFMPDHLHLLVHGRSESARCRAFIALTKQYSGYYYRREFGGTLWQRYCYERTLRKEEGTLVTARYILKNPVRAKLVQSVRDYPFVGSLVYGLEDLLDSAWSG